MPRKGYKATLKHRRAIAKANRIAMIGHKVSIATRKKLRKANLGKVGNNLGRKFNKKWKNNIRQALKGRKLSKQHRLNVIAATKKKWQDSSYKIRVASKISKAQKGYKSHGWLGGISKQSYPIGWMDTLKEVIRKRDNYKCQICNCPQKESVNKLSVHHIDYNKNNISEVNLVTLCRICHSKTNSNREYWNFYFIQKTLERIKCLD